MFSQPVYLSAGDEYDKREPHAAKPTGRPPFVVAAKRNPHISDATFGPVVSLSTGDPYHSVGFGGPFRQPVDDGSKKETVLPPFRPPGASKKSSGKGDYYGTFAEKEPIRHETEFPPIKSAADLKAETAAAMKNFIVNPAKKGTYGYPGLTIGQAGEVQYVADPYEGTARREALQSKLEATKRVGPPFRSAVRKGGCLDESAYGVSRVYALTKPLPPKRSPSASEKQRTLAVGRKPWVPGGALVPELSKQPEYQEDPYDVKEQKVREMRQRESSYKPWVPAGNDPYRFIYTTPIPYDPPMVA
ncbi:hypothetical protein ABB37_06884 [Leptomonas pyrrhocoris]|uniref:Cilia-and flagella-associated protein 96 n=1 Tax=Leptomonas pyrrhocoris TaxID=157538 RepID=A0A0N0VE63_LEPPY|nr:hypothetical protein ABB37_06884 [Leptomonas pyrrhocoris]XP_015655934.1 hypothetical protein ABB37_06884 [Leptomonas pyrrhocoris]KPA77494.1 hypothetical protein ABB37_06884 [Leptomonas pyrrhocoris]KPA77495.1 hypothetical protein ABB37_06884 [Leptomonas pyrrhocoris]|eukprot:XP_015655933.1 hypothetical protein ABB37_06884 [Leptomonas pyrrhocoris]